jgi:RNase P protein component
LVLDEEDQLKNGKYIFVAKNSILEREYKVLKNDFKYSIKKLDLEK